LAGGLPGPPPRNLLVKTQNHIFYLSVGFVKKELNSSDRAR